MKSDKNLTRFVSLHILTFFVKNPKTHHQLLSETNVLMCLGRDFKGSTVVAVNKVRVMFMFYDKSGKLHQALAAQSTLVVVRSI